MSFHGGLLGVHRGAVAVCAPAPAQYRRRLRFHRAAAGPRASFSGASATSSTASCGASRRRVPWGFNFNGAGAASLAALRGVPGRAGAVLGRVVVHVAGRGRGLRPRGCSCSSTASRASSSSSCACRMSSIGYLAGGWLTMGQVLSLPMILARRRRCCGGRTARALPSGNCRGRAMKAVSGPAAPDPRLRRSQGRSHRHRYAVAVRAADALRPGGRASRWSRPRRSTCARSSTSCCGSCAATPTLPGCASTASRSGMSGPMSTASSARSTASSGAHGPLPTAARSTRSPRPWSSCAATPIRAASSSAPGTSGELRADGAHALPCVLPVLRGRRPPVVPALPAQRGHLSRRAFQHRQLCAADPHVRAAVRPGGGRVRLDGWRLPPVPESPGAGGRCSSRARPIRCRAWRIRRRPATIFDYEYEDFEIVNYQHHAAIKAPVAV